MGPDSVVGCYRMGWSARAGYGGRFRPEYATGIGERENVVVQVIGPGEFKVTGVRSLVAKSKGMYGYLRREGESIADELIE